MTPRLISRPDAAAYLGLTIRGFDDWVKKNIVPGPIQGTNRWDRKAIDQALDRYSGLNKPEADKPVDDLDAWLEGQDEVKTRRRS